jgi:hypothetical protein
MSPVFFSVSSHILYSVLPYLINFLVRSP